MESKLRTEIAVKCCSISSLLYQISFQNKLNLQQFVHTSSLKVKRVLIYSTSIYFCRYIITCGGEGDIRIWTGIEDDEATDKCVGEKAFAVCQRVGTDWKQVHPISYLCLMLAVLHLTWYTRSVIK